MSVVQFDKGPGGHGARFEGAQRLIVAQSQDEVPGALAEMEAAQAAGQWLAGYASYELGYALTPKLAARMRAERDLPLIQFGVFAAPKPARVDIPSNVGLSGFAPLWSRERYATAFDQVKAYIAAGHIYQANLTFPMEARLAGAPWALYRALAAHQPVPHGAFVDLGGPALVSRSPELFFAADADGRLETRPMKGTAPRRPWPDADEAERRALRSSEKNQAENLMIVDLLRNDMSRVSELGSVKVPELFRVETYRTLHQMTSRITSRVVPGTTLSDLFEALFPCGSVTGAPKIRSMEILSELEAGPRGAYCGSVGWIAPDGAMEFNVAIRTITCFPDGRAVMGVGGGVVHDSTLDGEYDEALLKGRFARLPEPA